MISIDQIKNYTKFMTCAELDELRRYFNSAEFNKIYFNKFEVSQKEAFTKFQQNKIKREAREKRLEVELYPHLIEYCKHWLTPGDIIKFEGASSGGIRKVVEITNHTVLGLVVSKITKDGPRLSGYSSENSFEKLLGVYKTDLGNSETGTKCWFDRKSIVKFIKSQRNESKL
jgi:hypothetical protein